MEGEVPEPPKEKRSIVILTDAPPDRSLPPFTQPGGIQRPDPRINGLMSNIYLSNMIDNIAAAPALAQELVSQGDFMTNMAGKLTAEVAAHPNFRAAAQTALVESITKKITLDSEVDEHGVYSVQVDINFTPNEVVEAKAPIVARADEALRDRAENIIQGFASASNDPYIAARQERMLRHEASVLAGIGERLDESWGRSLAQAHVYFINQEIEFDSIEKKIPLDTDPESRRVQEMMLEVDIMNHQARKDRMQGVINGTISPYELTEEGVAARDAALALANQCRVDLSSAGDWQQGVEVDHSDLCAGVSSVLDVGTTGRDISPKR